MIPTTSTAAVNEYDDFSTAELADFRLTLTRISKKVAKDCSESLARSVLTGDISVHNAVRLVKEAAEARECYMAPLVEEHYQRAANLTSGRISPPKIPYVSQNIHASQIWLGVIDAAHIPPVSEVDRRSIIDEVMAELTRRKVLPPASPDPLSGY